MAAIYYLVTDNKFILNSYVKDDTDSDVDVLENLIPPSHLASADLGEWDEFGFNYIHDGHYYYVTRLLSNECVSLQKFRRTTRKPATKGKTRETAKKSTTRKKVKPTKKRSVPATRRKK